MLINTEDKSGIFGQIDSEFSKQSDSMQSMLYLSILGLIGYVTFSLTYPSTDEALKDTKNQIKSVQSKLSKDRSYLSTHSIAALNKSKSSLQAKQTEYDNTIYKISYVDNTLNDLSYLLFDDRSWANFVDKISELAKKYGVEISEISNKFYEPTFQKVTHVVEVDVKSSGSLKSMMKFLNALEESKLVIDVSNIKMSRPGEAIDGEYKIAVWGMKY
jgi:ppGpp synthetase/RelA/SpoT-type nucleotidyltranferase